MNAYCSGGHVGKSWSEIGSEQTYEYKLGSSNPQHRMNTSGPDVSYIYTGVRLNCLDSNGSPSNCTALTDTVVSVSLSKDELVTGGCGG